MRDILTKIPGNLFGHLFQGLMIVDSKGYLLEISYLLIKFISAYKGLNSYECNFTSLIRPKWRKKAKVEVMSSKNLADLGSGIILKPELMQGIHIMCRKEYEDEFLSILTLIPRLVSQYNGRGHIFCGDSAIASVVTCQVLYRKGVFFVRNVKNCSKSFSKKYLADWLLVLMSRHVTT